MIRDEVSRNSFRVAVNGRGEWILDFFFFCSFACILIFDVLFFLDETVEAFLTFSIYFVPCR